MKRITGAAVLTLVLIGAAACTRHPGAPAATLSVTIPAAPAPSPVPFTGPLPVYSPGR